jgi:transcriptional regulator NrdR family protein
MKCPHCKDESNFVKAEAIDARYMPGDNRLRVAYLCHSCDAPLSIGPDPDELASMVAQRVIDALERR